MFYAVGVAVVAVAALIFLRFVVNHIRGKTFLPAAGKAVVVTGCDTGFGRLTSEKLYKDGYFVIATCLTEAGAKELNSLWGAKGRALRSDVTSEKDVEDLRKVVETLQASGTTRLHAVINNAGIARGALVEFTTMQEYQQVMDVNFFGGVRVTKALLPFLVANTGRVVNITSIAGSIAPYGFSTYSASKFAFSAFTDSLRREMAEFGVRVSNIQPGFYSTAIVNTAGSMLEAVWARLPADVKQRYGEKTIRRLTKGAKRAIDGAGNPMDVVNALCHAVGSTHPKDRYRVGLPAHLFIHPMTVLPSFVTDAVLAFGANMDS